MKNLTFALFVCLIFSLSAFSQNSENKADIQPLTWKGVTIDVSEPKDVIEKIGKPTKEETGRIFPIIPTKIFTPNLQKKEWKTLKHK